MKFIRKNGRIIPIREDNGKLGKPISPVAEHAANMHGLKYGAAGSILLTPTIGVPMGFYARHRELRRAALGKKYK